MTLVLAALAWLVLASAAVLGVVGLVKLPWVVHFVLATIRDNRRHESVAGVAWVLAMEADRAALVLYFTAVLAVSFAASLLGLLLAQR